MDGNLVAISNSEIATWDRCRRTWYLKYFLGEVPTDEPVVSNQLLGTRVHAALEGWYGYELDPVLVLEVLYQILVTEHPEYRAELMAEREMAVIMVQGYLEWTAEDGQDALIKVVAVEQEIVVPFPALPGVALKARMDQVVWDSLTESLMFQDHKTAPNFDAHDALALNPQFKFYSIVQRLAVAGNPDAPRVMGGMINTLRRVKRTERSKPPYYLRDRFRYNDEELDSAQARVVAICNDIMEARSSLNYVYTEGGGLLEHVNAVQRLELYPTPRVHECRWDCPFVTLCPMMDDGSDWPGVLAGSGRYRQADPYAYYREDPLRAVRAALGKSEGGDTNGG